MPIYRTSRLQFCIPSLHFCNYRLHLCNDRLHLCNREYKIIFAIIYCIYATVDCIYAIEYTKSLICTILDFIMSQYTKVINIQKIDILLSIPRNIQSEYTSWIISGMKHLWCIWITIMITISDHINVNILGGFILIERLNCLLEKLNE